jgi:DNA (cytosine-5)-methyltransferase 1
VSDAAIDLFAGTGGSSEGAEQAGVPVVWAANHWEDACEWYHANHGLKPKCQDLHQANFFELPRHNILLASPSCQGHSIAKGKDKPHHDAARSTAWAVVSCAEANREDLGVVENTPEFLNWELYPAWKMALERLGYAVSPHIVDAADHGVPQNRVRVYVILTRSRAPLKLKLPRRRHVPASKILTDDAVRIWSPWRRMCARTRERVRAGRARWGERFLTVYYGSNQVGRAVNRPLGTLTTLDRFALVDGNRMGFLTVNECRAAMGFPRAFKLPENKRLAKHLLGNAVCPPVMRDILTELRRSA